MTSPVADPREEPVPVQSPEVSVVITAWNAADSIVRAVESVLADGPSALECIVVDDGSTDGTRDVVAGIAARDPRVVLVALDANGGVSAARNAGLRAARGRWLAFLDADDRLMPGAIPALLGAAARSGALVVIGQRILTDGVRTWTSRHYDNPDITTPGPKSLARNPGLIYYVSTTGKLFDHALTEGLEFEGRVLGDQPWTIRALIRAGERIEVIGDLVYEWSRPRRGQAGTITSRSRASSAVAADAARVAARGVELVGAELLAVMGDTDAARTILAAYVERHVQMDLSVALARALDRNDPGLADVLDAMGSFIAAVPDPILVASRAIREDLLLPPVHVWAVLDAAARSAWERMAAPVLRLDPALGPRLEGQRRSAPRVAVDRALRGGRRAAGRVVRRAQAGLARR